ncbi:hypothetical protein KX513_23455, partial [Escherichia coli]|nr:hypothetical protein [Escherichia coli]
RLRFSGPKTSIICSPMTSLKTSIKTITYLSDTGCLEIQGASLNTIKLHSPNTWWKPDTLSSGKNGLSDRTDQPSTDGSGLRYNESGTK